MSANDILISVVKSVCQVFSRLIEKGGAANWNRAVNLIEEQMEIVRRTSAAATQIPAMLIAADVYWRKTKNEWPDWVKIAECDEEGIKHHAWYARVTYELFPFDSEEDTEPKEREDEENGASRLVKPEPRDETIEASGRQVVDAGGGAEDEDEEDAQEPQDNAACREELKTSKSSRSGRKRADRARLPQPPNACSTCVKFGVTCVPRSSAACEPCSKRKKRCEQSTGIGRGRAKSRPASRSRQSARSLPASKPRHNSSAELFSPAAEFPPHPAKRRRLAPRDPPSHVKPEPIMITIPPLRRPSKPRLKSRRNAAPAFPPAQKIDAPLNTRQKTIPAKSVIPTPTSFSPRPWTPQATPGQCYNLAGEPLISRWEYSSLYERQSTIERRLDGFMQQIGSLHTVVEAIRTHAAALPAYAPPPPTAPAPFPPPLSFPTTSSQRFIAPSSPSPNPSQVDSASNDAFSNAISLTDEANRGVQAVSRSPAPSRVPPGSTADVSRPLPSADPASQSGREMPQGFSPIAAPVPEGSPLISPRVSRGNSLPRIETWANDELGEWGSSKDAVRPF